MPSKRMLPHTVTLFNYLGEIDGEAKYSKTFLHHVQCDENFGAMQTLKGRNSDDNAALYLFDINTTAESIEGYTKSYMEHTSWLGEGLKEMYWTLSEDDYFVLGESKVEDPRDIKSAFKITHYQYFDMGSARMRHFEIYGR